MAKIIMAVGGYALMHSMMCVVINPAIALKLMGRCGVQNDKQIGTLGSHPIMFRFMIWEAEDEKSRWRIGIPAIALKLKVSRYDYLAT